MSKLKCPNCGQTKDWMGVTMSHVLDPISYPPDGYQRADQIDSTDFELECKCGKRFELSVDSFTTTAGVSYRERIEHLRNALIDIVAAIVPNGYTLNEAIGKLMDVADMAKAALGEITESESKEAVERMLSQRLR